MRPDRELRRSAQKTQCVIKAETSEHSQQIRSLFLVHALKLLKASTVWPPITITPDAQGLTLLKYQ
jgi:hypothetical protein